MNDRWKDIEAIVDRVLSADPVRRPTVIAEACAGDLELRREVESLLNACEAAGGFLERPALAINPGLSTGSADDLPASLPERIAGYSVRRVLGVGGMGVVYVAEQDRPHRTVALKVIKSGLATPSILRRFEHEAEVLGRLHHPGIAQVYEAGTADGPHGPQPFFAMELIEGKPITEFVTERHLKTRERLELLARVCDAVQHAHQQGVIHRDLKPSNILVDATGQPKILDFGVARVSHADGSAPTLQTHAGQIIGTLAYMSPEQASGDSAAVDTRSDVYSLGVIGYQLLSGRLPLEIGDRPLHEGVRAVHEEEPAPLGSVDTAFRGDIDTVISKALDKNKDRRYQSAAGFAADLRRFLANEPVLARPPSAWYQFSKFAQRNRAWVSAAGVLAIVLVLAVVTLAINNQQLSMARTQALDAAVRETSQRKVAESEADKVREALVTIQSMFRSDQEGGGRDLRVVDLLDQFVAQFPSDSEGNQALNGFRHQIVGSAYRRLGEIEPARMHLEKALEARKATASSLSREILETQFEVAQLQCDSGELMVSPRPFSELIQAAKSVLPGDDSLILAMRARLAWAYLVCHDLPAAQDQSRSVLSDSRSLDPSDPIIADVAGTLVEALTASGNGGEALRELTERLRATGPNGNSFPNAILLRSRMANCLVQLHRHAEALELLADVRSMQPDKVPEVGAYATALVALARALEGLGQRDKALERFQQANMLSEKLNGEFNLPTLRISAEYMRFQVEDPSITPEVAVGVTRFAERVINGAMMRRSRFHPDILRLRLIRARALAIAGNIAECEQEFSRTYWETLERFGQDAPETIDALMWYSLFLVDHGKSTTIAVSLPTLYEYFRRTFGAEYPETLLIRFHLGYANSELHVAEAEELMQGAFQGLLKAVGPDHDWTIRVAEGLAAFYEANGRPSTAATVRPNGLSATPAGWRPAISQEDVVTLHVTTLARKAAKRAAAGDNAAAIVARDAAIKLLDGDKLLPVVVREENLRDILGERAYSLSQLGRAEEALSDAERALSLARRVAGAEPSDIRRRKIALCLIDVGIYRSHFGRAVESRDAFNAALTDLREMTHAGPDDEYTWRGLLHAYGFYGVLCAEQAKRVEIPIGDRAVWAKEGVGQLPGANSAYSRLKEAGRNTWFDDIVASTAQNAADGCRSVMAEIAGAEQK